MRAAFNIAVYYETKDSLSQAVKWAEKAQQLAKKIEKKNVVNNIKRVLTMCRIITSPASICRIEGEKCSNIQIKDANEPI